MRAKYEAGDRPHRMRRIMTVFGEAEYAKIADYLKRKKLSAYGLAKKAIREFMERHP